MFWIVRAQSVGEGTNGDWSVSVPCTGAFQVLNLSHWQQVGNAPSIDAHANVELTVSLVSEAAGDLDTFYDHTGWTWNPTDNLAMVIQSQTTAQGGFTEQDRTTIQTTQTTTEETNQLSLAINAATTAIANIGGVITQVPVGQVLSWVNPDTWRLVDLAGGVRCDRVDVDLSSDALWGCILRITQYPDTTVFRTPDTAWSFRDLAVLTFVHAGDIVERHGIHSTSHTVSPLPYVALPWPNNFGWPVQPSDYHVTVDWADGVCGELLGLRLP